MKLLTTVAELRSELDDARQSFVPVGFVPTMGWLHDGHTSLIASARAECDPVVTSIFVNPLQFGVGEDLDAYPRDLERDSRAASAAGTDILFVPSVEEMYPEAVMTTVSVADISAHMEGASRPTHFAGVATVVAKLFSIVGPCRSYFGEKDYQQLAVIRRMASDLSMPVDVVGCPTTRADDGLALSSRNVYLSEPQRAAAPVLHRALAAGAAAVGAGESDPQAVVELMRAIVTSEPLAELDYFEVVDARTLERRTTCDATSRLLGAVRFGTTRLIDNVGVETMSIKPAGAPS